MNHIVQYDLFEAEHRKIPKGDQEELIGNKRRDSKFKDKKVGNTVSFDHSSSSPPASWTEVFKITKIDGANDVYGIRQEGDMTEFDIEDMR